MELVLEINSLIASAQTIAALAADLQHNKEESLALSGRISGLIPLIQQIDADSPTMIQYVQTSLEYCHSFMKSLKSFEQSSKNKRIKADVKTKESLEEMTAEVDWMIIDLSLPSAAKLDDIAEALRQEKCNAESVENCYTMSPAKLNARDNRSQLCKGSFGDTHRMIHAADNRTYAVKRIQLEHIMPFGVTMDTLINESAVLFRLRHPNIVRHFLSFLSNHGQCLNIVTELIPLNRSLALMICSTPPVPEFKLIPWAWQMASALSYMHGEGVLHRDLKPENIKLTAGFGKIMIINPNLACESAGGADLTEYSSPEKLGGTDQEDGGDDVWSVGCILTELLTRTRLVDNPLVASDDPRRAALFSQAADISSWMTTKLLPRLLDVNPARRCKSCEFHDIMQQCEPSRLQASLLQTLLAAARGGSGNGDGDVTGFQQQRALDELAAMATDPKTKSSLATVETISILVQLLEDSSDGVREQSVCLLSSLVSIPAVEKLFKDSVVVLPVVRLLGFLETDSWLAQKAAVLLMTYASAVVTSETAGLAEAFSGVMRVLQSGTDPSKECSIKALTALCMDRVDLGECLVAVGVVPRLLQLLTEDTEGVRVRATQLLGHLPTATASSTTSAICNGTAISAVAEIISTIVEQLTGGTGTSKAHAARALSNLAEDVKFQRGINSAGAIPPLVQQLKSGMDEGKMWAAKALSSLAVDAQCMQAIVAAGAIPLLVKLLREGITDDAKEWAAGALSNLALDDGNKKIIAAAGSIPPLVQLLCDGTSGGKVRSTIALCNLSMFAENKTLILATGVIPQLLTHLREESENVKERSACLLRNLSYEEGGAKAIAATETAIPLLTQLLRDGTDNAKEHVAVILSHLACVKGNIRKISAAGALPPLVNVLKNGNVDARAYAAAALAYVSSEPKNASTITALGAIPPLVRLLREGFEDAKYYAAQALYNIAEDSKNGKRVVKAGAIPVLVQLLQDGCTERSKLCATGVLAFLLDDAENKNVDKIASAGAIPPLVQLLREEFGDIESQQAQFFAVRILADMGRKVEFARTIVAAGAIPPLVALLRQESDSMQMLTTATLAGLAAANKESKRLIAAEGGILPLVRLLQNGSENAQQEALRALKALAVDVDNKKTIAEAGAIPVLVQQLRGGEKVQAAAALSNLALNAANRGEIAAAGAISLLLVMKREGSPSEKERASRALKNLAADPEIKKRITALALVRS